ncbi:unnamed protein product [Parnassius apollo]|uniref:(apollo) hypothetical protein n=1 Tax=Parnassius apollo TaxID=110799 RepID=A0A8S3XRE7_PARAO|nr:unnamed protein product [Parnassius apollo]
MDGFSLGKNTCPKYMQQKKFAMRLDEAFGLKAPYNKNLQGQQHSAQKKEEAYLQPWPCIPRDRKFLSLSDNILTLPGYGDAASIFYKYDYKFQKLLTGATMTFWWQYRDVNITKGVGAPKILSMTEVGCSRGMINSYTRNSEPIKRRRVGVEAILYMRVSPDARYIAVAAVHTDAVHLLCWPSLEPCFVMNTGKTINTITWHPWRSALLATGIDTTDTYARVALFDVPTEKTRDYFLSNNQYHLDEMLFSRMTGELVVSLWNPGIIFL